MDSLQEVFQKVIPGFQMIFGNVQDKSNNTKENPQ